MHISSFAVLKEQPPRKNVPNVSFGSQIIEIMVLTISRYVKNTLDKSTGTIKYHFKTGNKRNDSFKGTYCQQYQQMAIDHLKVNNVFELGKDEGVDFKTLTRTLISA